MSYFWIAPTLAALSVPSVANPACRSEVIDKVVITAHSGRPAASSGFVRTWIILQGQTSESQQLELYMPYMAEDQFVPNVNSICKVKFHTVFTDGGTAKGAIPRDRALKVIDEISCGGGKFIMTW